MKIAEMARGVRAFVLADESCVETLRYVLGLPVHLNLGSAGKAAENTGPAGSAQTGHDSCT